MVKTRTWHIELGAGEDGPELDQQLESCLTMESEELEAAAMEIAASIVGPMSLGRRRQAEKVLSLCKARGLAVRLSTTGVGADDFIYFRELATRFQLDFESYDDFAVEVSTPGSGHLAKFKNPAHVPPEPREDKEEEASADPVFSTSNHHVPSSGAPPRVDGDRQGKYFGYFENEHGEQAVFVHDRVSSSAVVMLGDAGWDSRYPVIEGRARGVILDQAEQLWVYCCWLAATHTHIPEGGHDKPTFSRRGGTR